MIQDSGERRQFDSGAVRDIVDGKGRCDLLPLGLVAELLGVQELFFINSFIRDGNAGYLHTAIKTFVTNNFDDMHTAMLEVAKHYEQGAQKYEERNWEKGIPLHCYMDSAIRHLIKYYRGDEDERHDRAFLWNLMSALWTMRNVEGMCDLPYAKPVVTATHTCAFTAEEQE